ncbi:DUF523 domain-containing protein [Acinetobacter sp. ANC 4648]|uniref:DUF523 domain-containing protein n=1 Tax=Acinetobacter sp. ANC 4648 TaxID=1977875 RepID=UPI000A334F5F|nr:DUF523 domain-containing protein [Acinetobacter sp. ANC 4648]OTG85070.1 hypothetical protein B9T27_02305 [Acinetobacter sp. ANC 4648]
MKYLISACLIGQNVRYDGQNSLQQKIQQLIVDQCAVSICPEMAGGLSTPRLAAEIIGGHGEDVLTGKAHVLDSAGLDVSNEFIRGAYHALQLAQKYQVTHVILKANSPSCGSKFIYDGSFNGTKILSNGVTAALLKQHGYQVMTEDEFIQTLTP